MVKTLLLTPILLVWFLVRRLIGAGLIVVGTWGALFSSLLMFPAVIALVLLLISAYFFVTGERAVMVGPSLGIIGGWFAAMLAGRYAFPAGRSLLSPTYWESSWRRRAPILLLRSFTDDGTGTPFDLGTFGNMNMVRAVGESFGRSLGGGPSGGGGGVARGMGYAAARSALRMMHMSQSFEEVLVTYLKPYGPVVAIARPGERWRPAGAARFVVQGKGEEWKGVVTDLIRRSSLILMIAGKTPGVTWEVNQIISEKVAHKLWLFFPPGAPGEVAKRWGLFRQELLAAGVSGAHETLDDRTVLLQFEDSWGCQPRSITHERESYLLLVKGRAEDYFTKRGLVLLSTRLRPLARFAQKCFTIFFGVMIFAWLIYVLCMVLKKKP
jgi:hypothetical protein